MRRCRRRHVSPSPSSSSSSLASSMRGTKGRKNVTLAARLAPPRQRIDAKCRSRPYRSSDSFAFTSRKSFTPRDLRLRFFHPAQRPGIDTSTKDLTLRTRPFLSAPRPGAMHLSAHDLRIDLRRAPRETTLRNAGVRLLLTPRAAPTTRGV